MSIFWLLIGLVLVVGTAHSIAAALRLRSVVDFLLAMYLVASAEIVVVMLLLSPGHWLSRRNLVWTLIVVGFVFMFACRWFGKPQSPPFRPLLASCRDALRDPVVAVLAVAVLGAFAYVVALIVGTAPNDYDSLWYHLARAAFWKQQHAIAYIPGANDARLNGFPPNAEIAQAFTMILGQTERFVGFVQLTSLLASMLAIAGIGRRIGLSVRQALFGALLFATLPVIVLQSATGLNDLVFGGFLVVSAYFLFTWSRVSLALCALALGMAIGTKITALLGLPVLALLGALLYPRRRWPALVLVGGSGIAIGCYWYVLNVAKTGHLDGKLGNAANATTVEHGNTYSAAGTVAHFMRLVIDAVDPSGAVGRDRFLYLIGAAVVLALGVRGRKRFGWISIGVAVALAALPLAFRAIDHGLLHGYQKLWVSLNRPNVAFLGFDKHLTKASPFQSWYGPAGILLVLGGFGLVWIALRRHTVPRAAVVLALAPVIWLVLQAITTFYSLFDGRYVVFAVALGAAVWGLLLPYRPFAWAAAAVGVTALALTLVHYDEKPSGVNVLGGAAPTSVWNLSRAQALGKSMSQGETAVVAALERRAQKGEQVGLAIGREDVSYPYFGSRLDRRVVFVGDRKTHVVMQTPGGTTWLVLAPGISFGAPDSSGGVSPLWTRVVDSHGWSLYRHV